MVFQQRDRDEKRDLTDGNSERGERFVVVEAGSSGVQRIRNAFVAGIRDENGLDKGQCNPFRFAEAGRRLPLRYCGDAFVRILRFSQVGLVQRREILAAHNLTCPKLDQVLGGMVPVAVAFA